MTERVAEPLSGPYTLDPGSFRDRSARVFYCNGGVWRGLTATASEEWQAVSSTKFFQQAQLDRRVIATEVANEALHPAIGSPPIEWKTVLRHDTVPFISYPYEWSFGMLKEAALLQLGLLASALEEDIILKDASAFNVQWMGSAPIFIDVASFVRWRAGEPWVGYRQFCRMFLFPLMLQAYKQVSFQPWLRGCLDGIDVNAFRCLIGWRELVKPGVLTDVIAQSRFDQRYAAAAADIKRELRDAGFGKSLITANLERLRKVIQGLDWAPDTSAWSKYVDENSYDDCSSRAKEEFVTRILKTEQPRRVLDLGCNTGHFSKIAAAHAEYVVAIDSDHASVERLFHELKSRGSKNVLPLVMDLSDPSPSLGWRGSERRGLMERARADLVLSLALVHHLAITANIPLSDLVDWFAEFGADMLIEFPTPDDAMVQRLLLNKEQSYDDYCVEHFEACLRRHFNVRERQMLPSGTRILYHVCSQRQR